MTADTVHDGLAELSALAAGRAIATGRCTSEELVAACLERIAARDPQLHAWERISPRALDDARALDRQPPLGPLHGVPVGIKDVIDTGGLGTERGSGRYGGRVPADDAACVTALRRAGCVVLGKTVTSELATGRPGPTRNPWTPERTPGGSSSGSAAAVADRHVPLALGTQTSGSVSRPAAYCRIVGLKPTYGRISRTGVQPLAPELDTVGVLARTPDDAFAALDAMTGGPDGRAASPAVPRRVGWCPTPWWHAVESTARRELGAAVEELRAGGWSLPEVVLPGSVADLADVQQVLFDVGISRSLGDASRRHPELFSLELRDKLRAAARTSEKGHRRALEQRDRIAAALEPIWAEHDVLLAPVVTGPPPLGLSATGDPLLCRAWTALGLPTLALPSPPGRDGVPIGWQLVAPAHQEHLLVGPARELFAAASPEREARS